MRFWASIMPALNLHYEFDEFSEGPPGQYSERKAFDILQKYLQPDAGPSVDRVAAMIVEMLPDKTEHYYRSGEAGKFGCMVYEMSQQIPYHHPSQVKLVRLVQCLARSTKLNSAETYNVLDPPNARL